MNDRIIVFEKIANARDMGGLRTAQRYTVSAGLLIRSANLSEATEADRNGPAVLQNGDRSVLPG